MTATAPSFVPPAPEFRPGPLKCPVMAVPPEWIDYNGHMNVCYYTMAFDKSSDHVFDDLLGIGADSARELKMGPMILQQTLHYIGELLEGEEFRCHLRLLDHDAKKLHIYSEMRKTSDDSLCAISESISLNVDLKERRAMPYPDWAFERIEALFAAQRDLPWPERAGASISIRRR